MYYYELIKFENNIADINYKYCTELELDLYSSKFQPTIICTISKEKYNKEK